MKIRHLLLIAALLASAVGAKAQSMQVERRSERDTVFISWRSVGTVGNDKMRRSVAGLSVGYVTKQWVSKSNDGDLTVKRGFWEETARLHGVQAGVRVEPRLGWWLYLHTGLCYEFYYSGNKFGGDLFKYMEHDLYLPLHLELKVPLSRRTALCINGGAGAEYVFMSRVSGHHGCGGKAYYIARDVYGNPDWGAGDMKRFGLYGEFGGGISFGGCTIGCTVSRGLLDMSADKRLYSTKANKIAASFSIMF